MSQASTNPNTTFVNSLRTISVFNDTDETIPPYACMRFVDLDESSQSQRNFFSRQSMHGKRVIWHVAKPNSEACATLEPANFCFNRQTPIKKRQWGVATMDYPAQVLHHGGIDSLPNGYECGPVPDAWYVLSTDGGGTGFLCMSHDYSEAAGHDSDGIHTIWVHLKRERTGGHGAFRGSSGVLAGSLLTLSSFGGDHSPLDGMRVDDDGEDGPADRIRVTAPGIYWFSWQCSLSSFGSDAPRGASLQLDVMIWKDPESSSESSQEIESTGYYGFRRQEIEQDEYGEDIARGIENVACSGYVMLDADEAISIKNTSEYALSVGGFQLSLMLSRPFIRAKQGSLSYP